MDAFLVSAGLVALAEIGDRTQILAVMLVARFRRPIPVLLGVLVASAAAQFLASAVGAVAGEWLHGRWVQRLIGLSFIGFAIWTLLPEKAAVEAEPKLVRRRNVFMATAAAFFLMEMGDKTQFAALALAVRFHSLVPVGLGATAGMMIANTPAVLAGHAMGDRLPLRLIHVVAALASAALGVWTLATA